VFITFEGGEGSGKSTQLSELAERLARVGLTVLTTREPGGTTLGESVRDLLLDPANTEMDPRAELLLYEAARAQLVAEVIAPALGAGEIVLCDRFTDSTTAARSSSGSRRRGEVLHQASGYVSAGGSACTDW
jgi:dTMP kinase